MRLVCEAAGVLVTHYALRTTHYPLLCLVHAVHVGKDP